MRGLLIKDFLNLKEQLKILMIVIAVYGMFSVISENTGAFSGVVVMMIIIMVINTISYDERAKWDKFCLSTPISRKIIVLEKYFLGVILFAIGGLSSIVFLMITEKTLDFVKAGALTLTLIVVAIVMLSVILPMIFKLGVEKGRILMIVIMMIPLIVSFSAPFLVKVKLPDLSQLNPNLFAIIGSVAAIVMYSVSAMLSIRVYNKKEF